MDAETVERLRQRAWGEIQAFDVGEVDEQNFDETHSKPKLTLLIKFVAREDSYCILITNLVGVWWHESNAEGIERNRKRYCPSLKRQGTKETIRLLENLLCKEDVDKTYFLQIEQTKLILKASMKIAAFHLKWQFDCEPYGTLDEQAILLRDQVYQPLREMIRVLSFKLTQVRKEPPTKKPEALQPLPKESEADYEKFSLSYSFQNTLGDLYRGAMGRISMSQVQFEGYEPPNKKHRGDGGQATNIQHDNDLFVDHKIETGLDHKHLGIGGGGDNKSVNSEGKESGGGGGGVPVDDTETELARREELQRKLAEKKEKKKKKKRKTFV